jgi:AbrB family looped-hinge helix DNA binding protein
MALAHSKLTAQGQISVPASVRAKLGIGPGETIEWNEEDGKIVVRRAGLYSSADMHGALFGKRLPKPRSLEALKAGVQAYIKARHARR